jgi:hypothetical protein
MVNTPYLFDPARYVNLRKIPHLCGLFGAIGLGM